MATARSQFELEYGVDKFWEEYGPGFRALTEVQREMYFTPSQIETMNKLSAREAATRKRDFEEKCITEGASTLDSEAAQTAYDCPLEDCERLFSVVYGGRWIRSDVLKTGTPYWHMFHRLYANKYLEERIVADLKTMDFSIYYRLKGT